MKKMLCFILATVMVLCFFGGCMYGEPTQMQVDDFYTQESTVETEESTPSANSVIQKVALITDSGAINNKGYNEACWKGVESWCRSMNILYTYYVPAEDSTDARVLSVRRAVEDGANVIVLPGYIFGTTLIEVQETYPDVYFIAADVGDGDMTYDYQTYYEPTANTVCMTFAEEQAGYLAGYATVKEGYTQLGFSGGMAVPTVIRYGYGFIQGADAAATEMDVNIHIKYTYEGVFYCSSCGYQEKLQKLQSWIKNGTEMIFPCGGVNALKFAEDLTVPVVTADIDMSHISPNILTAAKKELKIAVEFALTGLYEGRWETEMGGQFINLSLQDGDFVGLPTTNESFRFQTFTMEEYESLKADIRTGVRTVSDNWEVMPTVSEHTVVEEIG